MAKFKIAVGDPKTGKSYSTEIEGQHANALIGKKLGDIVDGIFFGLPGYKVKITGGVDNSGFPMRHDLPGSVKKKLLVSKGLGFKPQRNGTRKKKTFRGNTISSEIVGLNVVITQHGSKPIEDIFKAETKKGD